MKLSPKLKFGIVLIFTAILFLVLNLTNFSKDVKNFFYLISSPIQEFFRGGGDSASCFLCSILEKEDLQKENEELKLKIQELLTEKANLEELKKENQALREALDLGLKEEFKLVLADFVSKDFDDDLISINKGSEEGISEGFPVITQQKNLVGRVVEVYDNFSKVMLISHKNSSFDANITGTEIYGVVKGKGDFKVNLELIPREEEIKKDDLLVTTTLEGIFPKGLLVGQVKEFKKTDVDPFQQAEINLFFNIKNLNYLFVITEF